MFRTTSIRSHECLKRGYVLLGIARVGGLARRKGLSRALPHGAADISRAVDAIRFFRYDCFVSILRRSIFFPSTCLALHPTSIAASALMTSSATPPFSTTIFVTWDIRFLFIPPLGGVQTPELASSSRCVRASALDVGAVPPVAEFIEFGMPGGVR